MKKYVLLSLLLPLVAFAEANEGENVLLSAQIQYQNALKEQNSTKDRITKAQTQLDTAKARLQDAQRAMQDAEAEHSQATTAAAQSQSKFEEAGRNLDKAWGLSK